MAYPYQPTYYPPQPVVYAGAPPPVVVAGAPSPIVVAGGAPSVVHTTTYGRKSYGRSLFGGYGSQYQKPSKRRTVNLLTINKSSSAPKSSKPSSSKPNKKSSSSSASKPSKKSSSSALPKKKKKKSESQKNTGMRLREMPASIGAPLGPQLSVRLSDEYTLRALMDKLNEVGASVDSSVRRYIHALFALCRDHGGILPVNADVPLDLQYMVARALYSQNKTPLLLTFVNESGERFGPSPARAVIDNERTVSAAFALPPGSKTTLNGPYAIEIAYRDRVFKHTGVFAENARTIHGDGETFHWMINLYEATRGGVYYKYAVPLPTLELTMTRSRTEENTYAVTEAVLVVDHQPRKHFRTLPAKGSDIVQVPALLPRPHMPYKAHMRDNMALQRTIHADLQTRLGALMSDSPNKWDFRCSVGARDGYDGTDHRVFLGTASEAPIAYAVMAMLADRKALNRVNDPDFLKEVLEQDANGARAIEVVGMLYDKYHAMQGKERGPNHQDFPSLLQLFMHTSGLPAVRSLRYDQVRDYYAKIINVLSGKDDGAVGELSYDKRELAALNEFANSPGADNDADVSVGDPHNVFEALLLAMFVRRFAAASPMAMQTPGAIINAFLRPGDFKLEWTSSQMAADPLIFSTSPTTTFSGLTSHVRMLTEELAQPSRANSIFFKMLSTRVPVAGEDADVVHSVGWMQQRVNDKLDLIFVGSVNDNVDTVVAAIVPQLAYFAVFHEMAVDFERPLQTTVSGVVDAIVESLNADSVRTQYASIPDRVRLSVSRPSRANKAWDMSFLEELPSDFVVSIPLPDAAVEFVDPFVVQAQRRLRTARFERADTSGVNAALVFSTGERVPLVYDTRRDAYYVTRFDGMGVLGAEVVVTPEYIQYAGKIYITREEFDELSRDYTAAYGTATQLANADVFRTRLSTVVRQGTLSPATPSDAFSLEYKIGHNMAGAVLGGMAAGATAAALAPRVWGPVAPGYPYGYPYYGYPYGAVVPYYYGSWGYRGFRHHGRRFHRGRR